MTFFSGSTIHYYLWKIFISHVPPNFYNYNLQETTQVKSFKNMINLLASKTTAVNTANWKINKSRSNFLNVVHEGHNVKGDCLIYKP